MKATTEDFLKLNTLRGTKTVFLTPKRYDEHPRHFYMRVTPGTDARILRRVSWVPTKSPNIFSKINPLNTDTG